MGIAFLLIVIILMGALTAAVAPMEVSEPAMENTGGLMAELPDQSSSSTPDDRLDASMQHYLQGLDPSSLGKPDPLSESSRMVDPYPTRVILFYENPLVRNQWLPLPTEEDVLTGSAPPVSFET